MSDDKNIDPRPVLVATDLSDPANNAIVCAHARALLAKAPLVVLHVIPYGPALQPLFPQEFQGQAPQLVAHREKLRDMLAEQVTKLTGRGSDACEVRVEFGHPYATIISLAEELSVGQIVVASRGASRVERLVLGSVAERVVRNAHCPVLVMRPGNDTGPVLAATDLSDAAVPAIEAAAWEAAARRLPLMVMHDLDLVPWLASTLAPLGPIPLAPEPETVEKVKKSTLEVLTGALKRIGAQGEPLVTNDGHPAAAILRTATEVDASIIVVGTRGRTGLARLALGNVAEAVVRHCHCSVLAVRMDA